MDYNKFKVTELKEMLSSRGLPTSGNKSDLVARLNEADSKQGAKDAKAVDLGDDLLPPEDEIDWDANDTQKRLASTTAAALIVSSSNLSQPKAPIPAAPAITSAAKPAPAPAAAATTKPTEPAKPSETTAKPAPSTDDAADAAAIELEKRKKRAERFGIPLNDSAKALERAHRFGVTPPAPKQQLGGGQRPKNNRRGNQKWTKSENEGNKPAAVAKAKILDDPAEVEKAKKRAERFGGGNEPKKVKT